MAEMAYYPPHTEFLSPSTAIGQFSVRDYYPNQYGRTTYGSDLNRKLQRKEQALDNYIMNTYRRFGGEDTEIGQYLTSFLNYLNENINNGADIEAELIRPFMRENPYTPYMRDQYNLGKVLYDITRKAIKIRKINEALGNGVMPDEADLEDEADDAPAYDNGGISVTPVVPVTPAQPEPVVREPLIPIGSMPASGGMPVDSLIAPPTSGIQGGIIYPDRPGSPEAWQQWMKDMRKKGFTDDEIMQLMNSYMAGYRSGGKLIRRR